MLADDEVVGYIVAYLFAVRHEMMEHVPRLGRITAGERCHGVRIISIVLGFERFSWESVGFVESILWWCNVLSLVMMAVDSEMDGAQRHDI